MADFVGSASSDEVDYQYHPGAPHVRIKPSLAPKDRSGQEAEPFRGDFEGWLKSGEWQQVSSSDVAAIAYKAKQKMVEFRFLDGSSHGYAPYEEAEVRGLYITGSKGSWLWDYVLVRGKGNKGKLQRQQVY